ncbi:hypothetical protein HGO40_17650 [Pseudomonas sp. CG7]|jgi:hypothetical protein|uniref:hypothetical protein n=1 Tax=Pseudomonas sp. CG7 TaxID=191007 RepID=UPI00203406F8|nr:hypothetical protein [Pseudomonas sp. CG7]MCM2462280.1 hypothetical protein [Pseudomonas sp. CG7]
MEDQKKCIAGVLLSLAAYLASSAACARDEVVNVEIHNATVDDIVPGSGFSWTDYWAGSGHNFWISPSESQELKYYLPQSRSKEEAFSYTQDSRICHFSFGHVARRPISEGAMPFRRWVKAEPTGYCVAQLIDVEDDDDYVRNGGTRIKFTMK